MIDVRFRVTGKSIPVDHGYALCAAVSRIVPEMSSSRALRWKEAAILPVAGTLSGEKRLLLDPSSRLTIRLHSDLIRRVRPLAGAELKLRNESIHVGVPAVYRLRPTATLRSRLVVIKGVTEPEPFLQAVFDALDELRVRGLPILLRRKRYAAAEDETDDKPGDTPLLRRTVTVPDLHGHELKGFKEIVGYAVEVQELTAGDSLRLQEFGIGGRRKLGCGVFEPPRRGE